MPKKLYKTGKPGATGPGAAADTSNDTHEPQAETSRQAGRSGHTCARKPRRDAPACAETSTGRPSLAVSRPGHGGAGCCGWRVFPCCTGTCTLACPGHRAIRRAAGARTWTTAGGFCRRCRLQGLPRGRIQGLGGLAPQTGDAGGGRDHGAGRLQQRQVQALRRRIHLLQTRRQVHGAHRRPGRQARRLHGQPHLWRLAAAAVHGGLPRWPLPDAAHRLGFADERRWRATLVPSQPRRKDGPQGPAALGRPLPELEPAMCRLPLDEPEKGL